MKKRLTAAALVVLLLATPAVAQLVIYQSHPVGTFEIKDSVRFSAFDSTQRITVAAQEVVDYSRNAVLQKRKRIVSDGRQAGDWQLEAWYEISTHGARELVKAIRALDDLQARVDRFTKAAPDNSARAVFSPGTSRTPTEPAAQLIHFKSNCRTAECGSGVSRRALLGASGWVT